MSDPDRPRTGRPAPDFALPAPDGSTVSLAGLRGRTVVLYFYPKDDTSGCTRQAVEFTGRLHDFRAAGAEVVGVSKDSLSRHARFIDKHDLGVTLLSDADGDVAERYGVWTKKSMYGRQYMGIERSTFLIDSTGVLRREWRKVKVPNHVDEVLAAVRDVSEPSADRG